MLCLGGETSFWKCWFWSGNSLFSVRKVLWICVFLENHQRTRTLKKFGDRPSQNPCWELLYRKASLIRLMKKSRKIMFFFCKKNTRGRTYSSSQLGKSGNLSPNFLGLFVTLMIWMKNMLSKKFHRPRYNLCPNFFDCGTLNIQNKVISQ